MFFFYILTNSMLYDVQFPALLQLKFQGFCHVSIRRISDEISRLPGMRVISWGLIFASGQQIYEIVKISSGQHLYLKSKHILELITGLLYINEVFKNKVIEPNLTQWWDMPANKSKPSEYIKSDICCFSSECFQAGKGNQIPMLISFSLTKFL